MSSFLAAGVGTVTVGVEAYQGFTNGKPAYGSSVDIAAQVSEMDRVVRMGDGQDVMTSLTLWVDAGESYQPAHNDRITYSAVTYIVVETKSVTDLHGTLDHTRVRCREEE